MALVSKITPQMRQAARLRTTTSMSVPEIASQLSVADSTVYSWLDKMNITGPIQPSVTKTTQMAPKEQPDEYEEIQDPTIDELREKFTEGYAMAQKDVFFRVICALYWGEGRLGNIDDLESTTEVSIASSDHSLINLWLKWLEKSEYDTEKTIRIHVNRNSPQGSPAIEQHWREQLRSLSTRETEIDVIRVKTTTKKISKKQKNGSAYITIYNGVLRALLLGGISYLKSTSTK